MAKHTQPTKEELQRKIKESEDKLLEIEKNPLAPSPSPSSPPPSGTPSASPSQPPTSPSFSASASPSQAPRPTGSPSASPSPSAAPTDEELKKAKEKLSASARENQKIYAKNRKLNQAIDEANEVPEPTEDELRAEFPEWDDIDDTQRKIAKETLISKRFRERISQAREEGKKIEKWGEDVDKFIEDPKTLIANPDLEGKQEEFKEYANRESNNSVPFNVLVPAFLFEQEKGKPPVKKGQMFEKGNGGQKDVKRTDGKISALQGRALMKTDFKKYKQLLKARKIANE